ncbi:hypothetical protein EES45_08560 [Streptomyces sp. ADI97-07]|nr:hypothetical protein EES45_08560 [Streptomyces sp. ADI97-07]
MGEPGEQLPVLRALLRVRAESAAQRADLLEGAGAGEHVGRAGTRVQTGIARRLVQIPATGLRGEQLPPSRAVRTLGEHRADVAVPVAGRSHLGGRRVHRAPGAVRHMLRDRQARDLRLPSGLAGVQHQGTVLIAFHRP